MKEELINNELMLAGDRQAAPVRVVQPGEGRRNLSTGPPERESDETLRTLPPLLDVAKQKDSCGSKGFRRLERKRQVAPCTPSASLNALH